MRRRLFLAIVVLAVLQLSGLGVLAQAPKLSVSVLVKSPAETETELQVICLFRSGPENMLHGSLVETNEKLHGLLDRIRKPGLFDGDLGETILLTTPVGTLKAKRLLMVGLGDSAGFTPERMYLVGKIAYHEASRLGIAHPFFAPTILDGGVTRFTTGEVAVQVVRGMRAAQAALQASGAAGASNVEDVTFLAGPAHAADTQKGIDEALQAASASR